MATDPEGDDNNSSDRTNVQSDFDTLDEFAHEVARAIAKSRGEPSLDLPPLEHHVDLEAVRAALRSDCPMMVRFTVYDTVVFVNANGVVAAPTEQTKVRT